LEPLFITSIFFFTFDVSLSVDSNVDFKRWRCSCIMSYFTIFYKFLIMWLLLLTTVLVSPVELRPNYSVV
jgi:hypothetical protein